MKSIKDKEGSINFATEEFEQAGYSSFSTVLVISIKLCQMFVLWGFLFFGLILNLIAICVLKCLKR